MGESGKGVDKSSDKWEMRQCARCLRRNKM